MTDDADEALTMRATVIGGEHCADDYQVIWRGMSIGRIRRASGLPHDQPQWSWSCYLQGRPTSAIDNGNGVGLYDSKANSGGVGTHPRWADRSGHCDGAQLFGEQRRSDSAVRCTTAR